MATSDQNQPPSSDQTHPVSAGEVESQTQGDERLISEQATSAADGSVGIGTGADGLHLVVGSSAGDATDYHFADNDLVAAIAATSPDTLASIEHTLDQLTTATDLFDVPAVDFDSGAGS
jgi:hypothetical protein